MSLHPGSRLGGYEVVELIGEGGMGSVYRALDTQLGRHVALKVVRESLAGDPDRVARFTREARLLASLNHPNIATVHGFEESGDVRFLVLELVPGVTLVERLAEGPLPVREGLVLAAQIAAALEAAHRHGVIHRDLKPGNIKITPDGNAKVLDFGLAKSLSPASGLEPVGDSATRSLSGTVRGTIMGTAAYMSPEQARGREVDQRTDIWAFGCVLFDMLTGKPAFAADTVSDTIVAILTRDPEWSRLPTDAPEAIRRLLRRSLERDLQHRLHDMGDARLEIEDALSRPEPPSSAPAEATVVPASSGSRMVLAGAILATALLTASAVWMLKPVPTAADRPAVQLVLPLPAGERIDGLDFPAVALSPKETHVAYVASRGGQQRLFVRELSALEAQPIAGTEGAHSPFFSPDGEWIGFFADGKLKKVPVGGGGVRSVCDAPLGFGGTWGSDGTIIYSPENGSALWRVSADGGVPAAITTLDAARGEFSHRWPELLPDASGVLYTVGTEGSWSDAEIVFQSLKTGERHTVVQGGTNPRHLPDGRLLYGREGSVYAAPFDARTGQVAAPVAQVLTGVFESSDGAVQVSVSGAGSVAYVTGTAGTATATLAWLDRQGNVQPLAAPPRAYALPRLAPDDRTIALTITATGRDEVWTYDIAGNALTQLTFDGGTSPVWTIDGRRLIFSANRGGLSDLFWKQADGAGPDERLTRSPSPEVPHSVSPDGRTVAMVEHDAATGRNIVLLDLDTGARRSFLDSPANDMAPVFSPDGLSLAYVSDESGRDEVYVAPVKDARRRTRVSAGGGSEPVWQRDGRALYFRSGTRMMVADHVSGVPPRVLFEADLGTGAASRPTYDVSADGARFLTVIRGERAGAEHEIRLFLGWPSR